MQSKHLCILIHIRTKCEVGTANTCYGPPVFFLLTVPSRCFFNGYFFISLEMNKCKSKNEASVSEEFAILS